MKVSSFFNLIQDGQDLLEFFENIDSREQLISRLEALKRRGTDELLLCVEGLRSSVASALGDTLEMSAVLDEPEDEESELDAELDRIASEGDDASDPGTTPSPSDIPEKRD